MLTQTLTYLPSIIGVLAIAIFVMARSKLAAFRAYGLFSIALDVWLFFQYLTDAQVKGGLLWIQLASASSILIALLFVIFAYTYPNHQTLPVGRSLLTLLPALILAPVSFTHVFIKGIVYTHGKVNFSPGPLYILQTAVLLAYFVLGVFILIYRVKHAEYRQRPQFYLLLTAFLVGLSGVLIAGFIFPDSKYWQAMRPLGILAMLGILAYAMIYHKLFDIRFFAVRAAIYLSTLFIMTLVFVTPVTLVFEYFLDFHPSLSEHVVVIVSSVLVLYALQYLRHFFDKLTTKVFFRNYYDPQDVLDKLSNVLVRTADIDLLRNDTAEILHDALKPTLIKYILFADRSEQNAKLVKKIASHSLDDAQSLVDVEEVQFKDKRLMTELRDMGVKLMVKLRTTHEDLGYMIVGYRQSGQTYTDRDKRLLGVAADEIAISLQNALRFKEIQLFNITLQDKVDEATLKLRRTNKKLQELDETKDDFISMASHQLRTPLTSVKGYLSMVLDGDAGALNDTQAKMLRQAFTSSQRMVFLITDLLNISRLKTGKFVIDAVPVDLNMLAQEEVAQLSETVELKQIELTYEKPATFPKLMLDETKTRQVVMNFIDNAIYYTPVGGHIRVELLDKPSTVELRVIDDGMGVPRSEQPHLFTKFYRATNARKARPDGTGLGLFMAKKAISAQGGSIIFSSRERHGSTFGFLFSKSRLHVPEHMQPTMSPVAAIEAKMNKKHS